MQKKTNKRVPPLRVPLTPAQRAALANHEGPDAAELKKIPEVDFDRAPIIGRGDKGAREVREWIRKRRGHPGKAAVALPTTTKSIRFSDETWAELEARAAAQGTTLHALLREIIVDYLKAG